MLSKKMFPWVLMTGDLQTPLLEVKKLCVQYPTNERRPVDALEGVGLTVQKQQIVGIVGESGSGKSTLCHSLLRLLDDDARTQGEIWFRGENLRDLPLSKMCSVRGQHLAMIFQNPAAALNPVVKVGDQVAETLWVHRRFAKKRSRPLVDKLLAQVGFSEPSSVYDRYPHQMSGGELQRILIASAIACRPQLLVADEPTTSLDTVVQKQVLDLLLQFRSEFEMSILYVSHDLHLVAKISDYVYVMKDGKIVESGAPKTLFSRPKSAYTKELLQSRRTLEGLQRAPGLKRQLPVAEGRQISKKFVTQRSFFGRSKGWHKAVRPMDLLVCAGETVGIVGESGSGKSTLAMMMMGLVPPTSGAVLLFEKDMATLGPRALKATRKRAQIVFQSSAKALNPKRSVGASIAEPLKIHGLSKNSEDTVLQVARLLETVELNPSFAGKFPHELSGGEQQRVCIARALACQPEFIVFDESVRSLDATVQMQIVRLLLDLQKQKKLTYLFISHDLGMVEKVSDRVLVMHQGRVVESGETKVVFSRPETEPLRQLLAARVELPSFAWPEKL